MCKMDSRFNMSLLLTMSLISVHLLASTVEGRLLLVPTDANPSSSPPKMAKEEKVMFRGAMGSRPPICERSCRSCPNHCEAVLVPRVMVYNLDYKPVTWKCKCGSSALNP